MKRKLGTIILDYLLISLGTLLYVISWSSFLLPNNVVAGGVTGISAILNLASGIPVHWWYLGINVVLLVLARIVLGRSFGIKTIYAIILSTILFRVLGSESMSFLLAVPGKPLYVSEKVLVPIIGGALEAIGLGIIMIRGGSTGGMDILALIVNKFWPISPGRFYITTDVVIIASVLLLPGHFFNDIIYGYITAGVFSVVLDFVLMGQKSTVQVMIFSNQYARLADFINKELDRGVTALSGIGWYTREERKVLLVIVRKTQLQSLVEAVKSQDPKAFVIVVPANSVFGEGFDEMKTGIKKK